MQCHRHIGTGGADDHRQMLGVVGQAAVSDDTCVPAPASA